MNATPQLTTQQDALADVQQRDFRAANLRRLVRAQLLPGDVLDVGCGAGGLVADLLEQGVDARGVDTSPPIIRSARRHLAARGLDPARVQLEPAEDLAAAGATFDNVVSMDCLEHVAGDDRFLGTLVRLVRPNGRLVITVPALMAVYGPRDQAIGHHRRYSRDGLLSLISAQPLVVEDVRYWNALGVLPVWLADRLRHRPVDESFRYGRPTLFKRALRGGLDLWFRTVEHRLRPPLGLTLVLTARRLPGG